MFDDLIRFEVLLWNALDARLRDEVGLPLGSLDVMRIVARTSNCRVYDIATALGITVGGTSQAVDRLEKRGLCARRPNPDDRRSSLVELTPEGQELLEAALPVFDRELERHLRVPGLDRFAAELTTLRASAERNRT
ncbi:MarR family transcriptional regulator [Amycolatopsis bartoniae]|nr:MarR family transcriptional regulator [Amycolatopsis bartoniae]